MTDISTVTKKAQFLSVIELPRTLAILSWENDILVAHLDESYPEDETYSQVFWYKNGWHVKEKGSSDFSPLEKFDEENFVIAGNIFDNPELMR